MSRKDRGLNMALKTMKMSFTIRNRFCPLYESISCCLDHILGYTDPNDVNHNPTKTRHPGE